MTAEDMSNYISDIINKKERTYEACLIDALNKSGITDENFKEYIGRLKRKSQLKHGAGIILERFYLDDLYLFTIEKVQNYNDNKFSLRCKCIVENI